MDGIVKVRGKRCIHDSYTRGSSLIVDGSKVTVYCKQHAEEGTVDVYGTPYFPAR